MTTFVLDTNIISCLLKKDESVFAAFEAAFDNGHICMIPPVAYYEVKRGLLAVGANAQLKLFDDFCRNLSIGRMEIVTWDKAARLYADLRRRGNLIEDADLFLAAFCIVGSYTLVTHNTKHFERIRELRCIDWKKS
jgi:predicted nucleic acid-binding protein